MRWESASCAFSALNKEAPTMPDSDALDPSIARPANTDGLFADFAAPPLAARPRAWWHWMDGNVNEPGVKADLEWLTASGAGGVQMFFGSFGTPARVPEPVEFRSLAWQSAGWHSWTGLRVGEPATDHTFEGRSRLPLRNLFA
jgi:hypothetical protein